MTLATIDEALERIQRGEMILVVDDEDRENEGDLQMAANWVTPEALNFMLRWARGLICMPAHPDRLDALGITPMIHPDEATDDTPFAITIDHVQGGSGIGVHDRALTIRAVADTGAQPEDFIRPGHVFPLRAKHGGVLERRGHTEAAVDFVRLAGLPPVAITCEILAEDGSPARMDDCERFAAEHGIIMVSIEQLVAYRETADTMANPGTPILL